MTDAKTQFELGPIQKEWLRRLRAHPERHVVPAQNAEQFLTRVNVQNGDCIEWSKGKNGDGYGYTSIQGVPWRTHRLMYVLMNGNVPDNISICHACDNRLCCNPDHLFAGTKAENNADRAKKSRNRNQFGENNNQSKLTRDQVLFILTSNLCDNDVARRFSISASHVDNIRRRYRWAHITDTEIADYIESNPENVFTKSV